MLSEAEYEGSNGAASIGRIFLVLLVLAFSAPSCLVRRTVIVPVPDKILAAKTATLAELLSSLDAYRDKIRALSSGTLRVSFTSGKSESGRLQAYRSTPAWIILMRPDLIRLNIQNPVTKTTLFELVSTGDPFSFWDTRENRLYSGRNSMKEIELEGRPLTLRPMHIFEAILPQSIDLNERDAYLLPEEDSDATTKYYVLSLLKADSDKIMRPRRRLWIDRSVLAVVRQEIFDDQGRVASNITYSKLVPMGDLLLPLSIKVNRPLDGYSLDMQFKDWRINPELGANAFIFTPPEGAQRVELKEKGRSE